MKTIIKFYILATIGVLLITASCSSDEQEDIVQVPKNCNCIKYNITKTITPLPKQVITEEIIEEPYCGEPTPYPIFIGSNNASNIETRIEAWYEIKCGANQY